MAKRKKTEDQPLSSPAWMSTWADLQSLVMVFFIMLYAMSSIDEEKFRAMAQSFANRVIPTQTQGSRDHIIDLLGSGVMQFPAPIQRPNAEEPVAEKEPSEKAIAAQQELRQMASDFQTYFAESGMSGEGQGIILEQYDYYILLTLPDQVLFDPGRANLKPESLDVLDLLVDKLADYPESDIEIEGHTDSDPINTPQFPSNWELSSTRANAVGRYMIEQRDFDPHRILAVGRGEYYPVAPNDTPENKAKNRRVEIRIKSAFYSGSALYE